MLLLSIQDPSGRGCLCSIQGRSRRFEATGSDEPNVLVYVSTGVYVLTDVCMNAAYELDKAFASFHFHGLIFNP